MQSRLYYFPIIHAPALCPYHPPEALFGDDYDPAREEAVWKFCGNYCWLSRELERPCLNELEKSHTGPAKPHAA